MHVTKIQQRNYKKLYALSTVRENKKYAKRSNLEDQIEKKKKLQRKILMVRIFLYQRIVINPNPLYLECN